MSDKSRLATNIDSELLRQFKIQVAKEDSKLNTVLEKIIKKYLEENKQPWEQGYFNFYKPYFKNHSMDPYPNNWGMELKNFKFKGTSSYILTFHSYF